MKVDTSTTAGKIAVMQAYEGGKEIQIHFLGEGGVWTEISKSASLWNWAEYKFRIKPQTVEQAAKAYLTSHYMGKPKDEIELINMAKFGAEWQKEQDS